MLNELEFGPPQTRDGPMLLQHFSQALLGLPKAQFVIARDNKRNGQAIGGASIRVIPLKNGTIEGRFLIFVAPEFRNRGVGTRLLEIIEKVALEKGAEQLKAGISIQVGGKTATRCQKFGLEPLEVTKTHQADIKNVINYVDEVWDKMVSLHIVPENRCVVELADADTKALVSLLISEIGGIPEHFRRSLDGPNAEYHDKYSSVALSPTDGKPVGALLVKHLGDTIEASIMAVKRAYQLDWVTISLSRHLTQSIKSHSNIKYYIYQTHPGLSKRTYAFSGNVGAVIIEEKAFFGKHLKHKAE